MLEPEQRASSVLVLHVNTPFLLFTSRPGASTNASPIPGPTCGVAFQTDLDLATLRVVSHNAHAAARRGAPFADPCAHVAHRELARVAVDRGG
jgi:hypothetical protein